MARHLDPEVEKFLECRDTGIRHGWEPVSAEREGRGFIETLDCGRCSTRKKRHLDHSGRTIKNEFEYPDGYLRKGGGRLTKGENAAIRLASLNSRYEGI